MSKNSWFGVMAAVVVSVVVIGAGAVGLQKYRESQCDHEYDSGKVTVEATCTEDGKMKFTCEECGKKKVEVIEATGHVEALVEEVSATCDKPGRTAGKVCSVCEEILEGVKEIPKLGHDMVTVEAKAATCTEDGNTAGLACSRCDYMEVESEIIPAGHTWNKSNSYIVIPTCSQGGVKVYTCEDCREQKRENVDPNPNYHNWNEGVETESATCGTEGVMTYTCNDCGATKTNTIPVTGESCDWMFCGDNGLLSCVNDVEKYYECTVCGSEKTEVILATGHNFNAWSVYTVPMCTYEGLKTRQCVNGSCFYTEKERIPVDPEAHFWDSGVLAGNIKTYTCENGCGATRTETVGIPEQEPCQHDYKTFGYCTLCVAPKSEEMTVAAGDKLLGYTYKDAAHGSTINLLTADGLSLYFSFLGRGELTVAGSTYFDDELNGMVTCVLVVDVRIYNFNAGTYTFGDTVVIIDENTTISSDNGNIVRVALETAAD